jgi:hypothetical protein
MMPPPPPGIQYQQAQRQQSPPQLLGAQPTGFAPGAMASYVASSFQPVAIDSNLMQAYSAELSASASAPLPEEYEESDEDMGFGLYDDDVPDALISSAAVNSSAFASAVPMSLGGSSSPSLSVESVARAQKFDGSFPTDPQHINMVTSGGAFSLPSALSSLGGDEGTKKAIWVTLLTIACMEKCLASEKEVWEFLADKARDYVSTTLQTLCNDSVRAEALMKELTTAATAAV